MPEKNNSVGMVDVGIANEGILSISVDVVRKWEPKNITYFSDVVYFKAEDGYYSMKRSDFINIYNK